MGTKTVSDDIKRYKRKRWIRSFHDIPLLPTQIAIQKDLSLIFDIIDPKTYMELNEFLEPPNGDGRTRSSLMSVMEKAIKNRTINHQKRNLFRRHQRILLWLYNNNCIGPLLMMKKKQRRKTIGRLLGDFDTEENRIRKRIYEGDYVYRPQKKEGSGGSSNTVRGANAPQNVKV